MKYKEYKGINYAEMATGVLNTWKENNIFEKSVESREGNPVFTFYEGPPSANGTPGIHHVMARAVKDIFCRYKTLKGFQVKRKGGWDTHGLPVELQVEKELGITKVDIGTKITVEEYNQKCREAVMKFKDQWDDLTEKMGYWVDLDNPYITFEPKYMESVWSLLKKFYDKGLLYKGFTIQPYSPAAGTGLSSHELNQPGTYQDVKDTTAVAQFKIEGTESDYILAWTTTPWTLAANTALAVGKGIVYVKVETFNPYTFQRQTVILAKDRMSAYFNSKAADLALDDYKEGDKLIPYNVLKEFKGSELIGTKYEQLMPYVQPNGKAFEVIEGDFVTTADGTGIVHISPTFGADDFRAAQKAGIGSILVKDEEDKDAPIVDKQGKYVKEMGEFAGLYVKNQYHKAGEAPEKSLDVLISIKLKEENKAFKVEKYEHSYPHCWRTDKPVLYYPMDSWFIKTTAFKDRLVELNKTINWKPESTGTGRFGNWLENLVDWNLSRSRYWGTPLPIWVSEDRKEEICIGSIAQLKTEVEKSIEAGFMRESIGDDFDLHRPYVDDVFLVSPTGQKLTREADLIDVWFDSGAMPYAQWHYPFENEDIFNENYPADFIAEGVDQTRGWFFTLHAISVMLFDKVAFKNVMANGLVLDKKGNKMSKRLGNAVDPFKTIATYGPDATRWYMIANANPWDNLKFNEDGVAEAQRRFFGTLHNTYNFFALYANLDQFEPEELNKSALTESDQWILSKLNSLIKLVDHAYESYEPTRATRLIQSFVIDDLSNWYVRLNRKRFWKSEFNENKKAAYQTLHTCLKTVAKLASPVAPFYCDNLYHDLTASEAIKNESVHLADYPVINEALIDTDLEVRMSLAQNISSLVHSLRKKHKIKVRQPLSKILIPVLNKAFETHLKAVEDLILTEINVKHIEYMDDASGVLVKKIKPNFRSLGKLYGPKMKDISAAINGFSAADISTIEQKGTFEINIGGEPINLTLDDVEISSEDIPGWLVASEGKLTVALDVTITDELRKEGIARDLVNRIQNIRKDMGLEIQDKIKVTIQENEAVINDALSGFNDYICTEVQALSLDVVNNLADGQPLEMDEFNLNLKVEV
ncbi:MAG: isoleucine--tRNA ligase [Cyclobacteriaceae bacterium]|nr:isoleucine--tRNA ligase [Cyclobacteriaceae bacterium]